MNKELILLAASEKYQNYCIAGIDTSTGEWIRIVSEDPSIHGAVRQEDMHYETGTIPEIFDIIKIPCKKYQPSHFQPENHLFNNQVYWEKTGKASMHDVLKIHPLNQREYIFFDTNKKIHKDQLSQISQTDIHSLVLISVQTPILIVKQWEERKEKDITMNFIYRGIQYRYLKITDINYKSRYLEQEEGSYRLPNNIFLVISLGECYDRDNYKLIATIIEKDS